MGILFGLFAALFWGLGDFLISYLTRHSGTARALLYVQVLSLLAWIVLFFAGVGMSGAGGTDLSTGPSIWTLAVITGIFHVLGLALTYRAFEIGTLSLVSPIASGFAVVTAVLSLISGETPPAMALLGALLLIAGVVLATRTPSDAQATGDSQDDVAPKKLTLAGVPEALGSAVAFGTMFWMFYFYVQPNLGYVYPLIILKTMSSGGALISVLATHSKSKMPELAAAPDVPATSQSMNLPTIGMLALGAALTDTLAWVTYIWGTSTQYATVVTALASLFSVITILLAWLLLRERLAKHQWAGVAVILLGILLVST